MKAFRVKYKTQIYRVLSELMIVPSEDDIPSTLARTSDKNFRLNDPDCYVIDATEIPIEDLPVRELTIGQLYALIDHRMQNQYQTKTGQTHDA